MCMILTSDIPLDHLQSLEKLTLVGLSFWAKDEIYFSHVLRHLCSPHLRHIQWDFIYEGGTISYSNSTKDIWQHLDIHLASMPGFETFSVHMTVDGVVPSVQDVTDRREWFEWLLPSLNHQGILRFIYP